MKALFYYRIKTTLMKALYNLELILPTWNRVVLSEDTSDHSSRPIFIVGCFRSGTSLLRRIIDSHSQIACPPESKFVGHLLRMLEDRESMKSLEYIGFSREYIYSNTRRYIESYLTGYAKSKGKAYWADKTPDYVEHIDTLDRLFNYGARMVFIYRNGLDVATSLYLRNFDAPDRFISEKGFKNKFAGCAAFWEDQVRKMKESRALRSNRVYEIRYEDLVMDTDNVLEDMFQYLELTYEPEIKDYHLYQHDKGFEDGVVTIRRGIKPSMGNYRHIPQKDIDSAMKHIGKMMQSLGYEVHM